MTREELRQALEALDPRRASEMLKLEMEIQRELSTLPAALADIALGADMALADKARTLVAALGSRAVAPLLDAEAASRPETEVWRLSSLAAAAIGLRALAAERLHACLNDRRPVPLPPVTEPAEEQPHPRRVCDEAFLLLRELTVIDESKEDFVLEARRFLRQPESERDAGIAHVTAGLPFTRLVEDLEG